MRISDWSSDVCSSDLPFENRLKVRFRVDGVLEEGESPPANLTAAIISRIKIMARLNIAERRLPQDGRIMVRVQGKELDKIGRATCRERVCQYDEISVVAGSCKQKQQTNKKKNK